MQCAHDALIDFLPGQLFPKRCNFPRQNVYCFFLHISVCLSHINLFSRMSSWANEEERRRLFEYFIVAGLNDGAGEAEELTPLSHECGNKIADQVAPITDVSTTIR